VGGFVARFVALPVDELAAVLAEGPAERFAELPATVPETLPVVGCAGDVPEAAGGALARLDEASFDAGRSCAPCRD
jgi:hypothetical protein